MKIKDRVRRSLLIRNPQFFIMEKYRCIVCGYMYDPEEGDAAGGIDPGVPFNDLPVDYICPVCGAGKDEFIIYS